ncbi:hypothetical protein Nepgr_002786 [Nepenthes gracilis]|uniref:Secreted protein n=1 Tax=Nepenthes gracilis TaxID=150966 RepID=A0AAD3RX89_NEPGR|nr:hypothetical protein Nepgr_002786 [Nepenthes gracilis]
MLMWLVWLMWLDLLLDRFSCNQMPIWTATLFRPVWKIGKLVGDLSGCVVGSWSIWFCLVWSRGRFGLNDVDCIPAAILQLKVGRLFARVVIKCRFCVLLRPVWKVC